MPEFFQTRMGMRFFESQLPKLIETMERIARVGEQLAENYEPDFCADCGGSTAVGSRDPHVCGEPMTIANVIDRDLPAFRDEAKKLTAVVRGQNFDRDPGMTSEDIMRLCDLMDALTGGPKWASYHDAAIGRAKFEPSPQDREAFEIVEQIAKRKATLTGIERTALLMVVAYANGRTNV